METMTRREFGAYVVKGGALVLVAASGVSSSVLLSGCGVIQDIETWVPEGIAAVNAIENLLISNGFPVTGVALVAFNDTIDALNLVLNTAKTYASTNPPPSGALQKLQAAIAAVVSNLSAFLQAVQIPDMGLISLIVSLAQIIISTILGFANQLPTATQLVQQAKRRTWKVGATSFNVQAQKRSPKQFKHDFNQTLTPKYSQLYVR